MATREYQGLGPSSFLPDAPVANGRHSILGTILDRQRQQYQDIAALREALAKQIERLRIRLDELAGPGPRATDAVDRAPGGLNKPEGPVLEQVGSEIDRVGDVLSRVRANIAELGEQIARLEAF